jgi:hypothetical protein
VIPLLNSNSVTHSAELWGGVSFRHQGVALFDMVRISRGFVFGLSAVSSPIGQEALHQFDHQGSAKVLAHRGGLTGRSQVGEFLLVPAACLIWLNGGSKNSLLNRCYEVRVGFAGPVLPTRFCERFRACTRTWERPAPLF